LLLLVLAETLSAVDVRSGWRRHDVQHRRLPSRSPTTMASELPSDFPSRSSQQQQQHRNIAQRFSSSEPDTNTYEIVQQTTQYNSTKLSNGETNRFLDSNRNQTTVNFSIIRKQLMLLLLLPEKTSSSLMTVAKGCRGRTSWNENDGCVGR